jgi:dTDP-4-dehydrorhamnose 3,5-epimerase-like enzyme
MTGRFEDERGVIQDLLTEPLDSVTEIFTKNGAIRGNHIHAQTTQWTYIVSGRLRIATRKSDEEVFYEWGTPGKLLCESPGIAHAWQAMEDTCVLVFTRGPRSGDNYEDDVTRLSDEERLIIP